MITEFEIECTDGFCMEDFQNLDTSEDWKEYDPSFEWTEDDIEELRGIEMMKQYDRQKMEAMAGWWDMEGVRCATFGRNPSRNPYRELSK